MEQLASSGLLGRGDKSVSEDYELSRLAVLISSEILDSLGENKLALRAAFSNLRVDTYFPDESGTLEQLQSNRYDLIALVGRSESIFSSTKSLPIFLSKRSRFDSIPSELHSNSDQDCIIVNIIDQADFPSRKVRLEYCDSVICCGTGPDNSSLSLLTIFKIFESLRLPGLVNIDLSDFKRVAKGLGVAFSVECDSSSEILSDLPPSSLVCRSALLHFTCDETVSLNDLYSISKRIVLRRGEDPAESIYPDFRESRRMKKVNLKMGIRIRTRTDMTNPLERSKIEPGPELKRVKRIQMTAVVFGLK